MVLIRPPGIFFVCCETRKVSPARRLAGNENIRASRTFAAPAATGNYVASEGSPEQDMFSKEQWRSELESLNFIV